MKHFVAKILLLSLLTASNSSLATTYTDCLEKNNRDTKFCEAVRNKVAPVPFDRPQQNCVKVTEQNIFTKRNQEVIKCY